MDQIDQIAREVVLGYVFREAFGSGDSRPAEDLTLAAQAAGIPVRFEERDGVAGWHGRRGDAERAKRLRRRLDEFREASFDTAVRGVADAIRETREETNETSN